MELPDRIREIKQTLAGNTDMAGTEKKPTSYFSFGELGIIALLAVLAVLSGTYAPQYLLGGGDLSGFVYGNLKLPGPGAGVLVFGSILCFWLMLGLLIVKKPGTAMVMSVIVIALNLFISGEIATVQALDVILFVAAIIEVLVLLPFGKAPLNYAMPVLMAGLGTITLFLAFAGQAKVGENGAAVTGLPPGYVIIGILALCYAIVCYRYPVDCFAACAGANMYYILHFWLFWGTSFAGRLPVSPDIIPVLFCGTAVGGVLAATGAYGIDLIRVRYAGHSAGNVRIS